MEHWVITGASAHGQYVSPSHPQAEDKRLLGFTLPWRVRSKPRIRSILYRPASCIICASTAVSMVSIVSLSHKGQSAWPSLYTCKHGEQIAAYPKNSVNAPRT